MAQNLIEFNNVILGYGNKAVLPPLNIQIQQGDFLGIIGPNGSGKTTILKAVLGLIKPMSGRIIKRDCKFGYVKQHLFLDEIFPLSVEEIVMMGRYGIMGPFNRPGANDRRAVKEALEAVGIAELAASSYKNLSGGQKQRVLLARALSCEPDLLVLDEPTNDLDIKGTFEIMELIKKLHETDGLTVILVSHSLNDVLSYVREVTFLNHEEIKIYRTDELLNDTSLSAVFALPVRVEQCGSQKYIVAGAKDVDA